MFWIYIQESNQKYTLGGKNLMGQIVRLQKYIAEHYTDKLNLTQIAQDKNKMLAFYFLRRRSFFSKRN